MPISTGDSADQLPYSRPFWTDEEINAVADVVRSGRWTAGPRVAQFERALAELTGAPHVVCLSSGTAAIHALLLMLAEGSARPLFVTSALNFVGGPAAARHAGYDVACTDIDPATLTMRPAALERLLSDRAGDHDLVVVMPVHFGGTAADMTALARVTARHGAVLIEDACHAIGGRYAADGPVIGNHPRSGGAVFSFHPTKPVAAGEGGAVAVADDALADRIRSFRNHNMDRSAAAPDGHHHPWYYSVEAAGLNLRLSEFHAAIGLVQLGRLRESLAERRRLAGRYLDALSALPGLRFLPSRARADSGWHLFPISFDLHAAGLSRQDVFDHFAACGIALQVHYTPVIELPAFADPAGIAAGHFPGVEDVCPGLVSLPLFLGLTDAEQDTVIAAATALAGGRVRA